jgi:hypothetical protein
VPAGLELSPEYIEHANEDDLYNRKCCTRVQDSVSLPVSQKKVNPIFERRLAFLSGMLYHSQMKVIFHKFSFCKPH